MAVPDIETQLYSKIWDLLNADSDWSALVFDINQIRYDKVAGSESPMKPTPSDGDYPQASMDPCVSGISDLYTSSETFGTFAEEGTCPWLEKHRYTFVLKVTSQLLGAQEVDTLGALTRNAIRKGGPRLGGIEYVTGVRVAWNTRRNQISGSETTEFVYRWVTTLTFTIDCVVDGDYLTGE